jgi:hypothetical protein
VAVLLTIFKGDERALAQQPDIRTYDSEPVGSERVLYHRQVITVLLYYYHDTAKADTYRLTGGVNWSGETAFEGDLLKH